ncbi:thiol:disulfide interchange protein DsbA/DsbL [Basfia succiniciproducens]|uniref:Thiol:disulfide interchange protein DsbA n=1 Tax=Basfia succiniciproducens TaxID=653940 RepID=A0A1G5C544_9PAST|nr:thiol:disulfide interchange protein DsbA/DsbL [Basfia succiniciproducens]QIM68819.1 thiol:disulfide interchange protein [Basfia succiniciproducens]SCX97589.1 thiol:disulfide interchange protein DsbA [Basfia succiniciproducens]SEP84441.1 thiol:disulfide interchange protein DsbA [Basfia succiniciproducens]
MKIKFCCYLFLVCLAPAVFAQKNTAGTHAAQTIASPGNRAAKNEFQDGQDYFSYSTPIHTENRRDGKILIQSFFDYDCRVCVNTLDILELYSKINPNKVVVEEYPIATKETTFSAQVYYSLKRMNHEDIAELLLFETTDIERYHELTKFENLLAYLKQQNVDEKLFTDIYQSAEIRRQVSEAIYRTEKYGVFTYPFVVIGGKYVLTNSTLYNDDYTFAVLDFLVHELSAVSTATHSK